MNVRPINIEDEYEAIAGWWKARGLVPPPAVLLGAADGFMVQHDGADLVAGWIYMTHRGIVGIVEWVTSNPAQEDAELISQAVDMLHDFLQKYAGDSGCTALFCSTADQTSLSRRLLKTGWVQCPGEPHAMFVKSLV